MLFYKVDVSESLFTLKTQSCWGKKKTTKKTGFLLAHDWVFKMNTASNLFIYIQYAKRTFTMLRQAVHGSNLSQFSRNQPRFEPCMGRLNVAS